MKHLIMVKSCYGENKHFIANTVFFTKTPKTTMVESTKFLFSGSRVPSRVHKDIVYVHMCMHIYIYIYTLNTYRERCFPLRFPS